MQNYLAFQPRICLLNQCERARFGARRQNSRAKRGRTNKIVFCEMCTKLILSIAPRHFHVVMFCSFGGSVCFLRRALTWFLLDAIALFICLHFSELSFLLNFINLLSFFCSLIQFGFIRGQSPARNFYLTKVVSCMYALFVAAFAHAFHVDLVIWD